MISEIILSAVGGVALCIYLFREHMEKSIPCNSCRNLVKKYRHPDWCEYRYTCARNGMTYQFNKPPEICGCYCYRDNGREKGV